MATNTQRPEDYDAKKLRAVQQVVVTAIKGQCAAGTTVTQDTFLGAGGIGHAPSKRQQYCPAIQEGIPAKGFALKIAFSCNALTAATFMKVRDITAYVNSQTE